MFMFFFCLHSIFMNIFFRKATEKELQMDEILYFKDHSTMDMKMDLRSGFIWGKIKWIKRAEEIVTYVKIQQ